jgi:hypothetical protein
MLGLDSAYALTGNLMDGGGGKRKKSNGSKMKRRKGMKRYSMSLFGGAKQFMCTEVEVPPPVVPPVQPVQPVAQVPPVAMQGMRMAGGKMSKKASMYKKMLSNMTVERLQKLAVKRGVKITKKKDGKVVQVKKATLVRKLCECKYGKSKSHKSRK